MENEKFKNKFRIASTRLQHWDYANEGAYYITICTKDRIHYFGEIKNGVMHYSPVGVIANVLWFEIKNHAKNVELGEFTVMPNHIHGIIILQNGNTIVGDTDSPDGAGNIDVDPDPPVETRHALSLRSDSESDSNSDPNPGPGPGTDPHHPSNDQPQTPGQQRFQNQGKNTISSIVGGYKSSVTKHANRLGLDFGWQPRFYDNIIRDAESFDNISNYIQKNAENWEEDKLFGNQKPL